MNGKLNKTTEDVMTVGCCSLIALLGIAIAIGLGLLIVAGVTALVRMF